MLTIAAVLAASAQVVAIPVVDAQTFRPAFDAPAFSWVDVAERPVGGPILGVAMSYTRSPLVHVIVDERSAVLRDLVGADLTGGYAFGPVRVGVQVPVVARATGWAGGESGLADVGAVVRFTAVSSAAIALALDGRLWFPTTTLFSPVGERGVSGEFAAVASRRFGKLQLAANVGYRMMPQVIVEGGVLDDAVTGRLGGAFAVSDAVGLTAETVAQVGMLRPRALATPVEALIGGYVQPKGPVAVKAALGRGLTNGVGAPAVRAVASVVYVPSGVAKAGDKDRDGIVDSKDKCPQEAEDPDGWEDEDGCPEQPLVVFHLYDEAGRLLPDARATVMGHGIERLFAKQLEIKLDPGTYTVVAHNPGYADIVLPVVIQDGPPRGVNLVLKPVRVVDVGERLDVSGEIFFESGSDTVMANSLPLLDEVAVVMRATTSVLRLRIEGHTDTRGLSEDNLVLSQRRAEAVRNYLVSRGVEPVRLVAKGFGESQPLVAREDEAAHAMNRRVVFVVEDRAR